MRLNTSEEGVDIIDNVPASRRNAIVTRPIVSLNSRLHRISYEA